MPAAGDRRGRWLVSSCPPCGISSSAPPMTQTATTAATMLVRRDHHGCAIGAAMIVGSIRGSIVSGTGAGAG